jgi:ABC-type nickel/cobalt efflux system permease component RcnA
MIDPRSVGHILAMSGGIFATLVSCAVAIFAARKAARRTKRTPRRA